MSEFCLSNEDQDPESNLLEGGMLYMFVGTMLFILANCILGFKRKMITLIGILISTLLHRRYTRAWKRVGKHLKSFGISIEDKQNKTIDQYPYESCPLCLSDFQYPVIATCGHPYCGKCIIDYWETKMQVQIRCPLCRRSISMLITDFSEPSGPEKKKDDLTLKCVQKGVHHYNLRYSKKPRNLRQKILDAPFLLSRFFELISSGNGVMFVTRRIFGSLYFLLFVFYLLSPLDLIPDTIPIVGYLDDMILGTYILLQVTVIYYNYLRIHQTP